MRLSSEQRLAIREESKKILREGFVEIYLYGSRLHDDLKGGDIDLLILVEETSYQEAQSLVYKVLNEIKKTPSVGDQRIDIKIATSSLCQKDPFLKSILDELQKL